MVGDNYYWDYKPARNAGIDALLIETQHHAKDHSIVKRIQRRIKKLKEVLEYL